MSVTVGNQKSALPIRPLGLSGLTPTALGLGGAPLGELFERLPEPQADDVVQAALDEGITFFDTAPFYGHGLSEHRIGRSLRQVDRNRVIVSTKVGRVYRRPVDIATFSTGIWAGGLHFELRFDYSDAGILRSYEDSLLRLGLNRVDSLVIHDLDGSYHPGADLQRHRTDLESSGWAALEALRGGGEIAAIGAGIMDCAMMRYFLDRFDLDFFLVAMPYTLLDHSPPLEEFIECQKRAIGIVIGSPYASGILATGPVPGATYNYAAAPPPILDKTRRILVVCEEFGVSLQAAALQFPLAHPAVTAVIPGATSRAIVAANVANLGVHIPAELWEALKARGLILPDAPVPKGTLR
jgi:D-threo-aldose 1-dehydrogenase